MSKNILIPMKLNFFSEGEPPTPPPNETPKTTETPPTEKTTKTDPPPAEPPKTFGEADVQKIIGNKLKEWESLKTKEIETTKTEAEKLAGMSAEQKAEYTRTKKDDEINQKLADVTKRELRIEAHKTFEERGLPVELLEVLQYSDAENCNKSIDSVEKAFRAAVEKGVNQRLQGTPPKTPINQHNSYTIEQIKNMTQAEIMANYSEVEKTLKNQ